MRGRRGMKGLLSDLTVNNKKEKRRRRKLQEVEDHKDGSIMT